MNITNAKKNTWNDERVINALVERFLLLDRLDYRDEDTFNLSLLLLNSEYLGTKLKLRIVKKLATWEFKDEAVDKEEILFLIKQRRELIEKLWT